MKIFFTFLFLYTAGFTGFCQGERKIWYFGSMAGLDFNSGSPVALTNGAMFTYDNCTSVADNTGGLLFYSNGVSVWNKNNLIMPNGNGLLGNTTGGNSAFAIKQPGNNNNYYIFTSDAFAGPDGIRYSVVDMNLQGGLGDVTAVKNVLLLSPATEKIVAVKHANNTDIWIIIHQWNSASFYAYLLTSSGLGAPVISTVGTAHSGNNYNAMGQISASPSGNKIIVAVYLSALYELFDFNRSSGVLSNPITINGYANAWGAEFSPDGTKLYTSQWTYANIYQFDITSNNAVTIANSAMIIGTVTGPDPSYKAGYLQLGPDNRIYIAKFTDLILDI